MWLIEFIIAFIEFHVDNWKHIVKSHPFNKAPNFETLNTKDANG